MARREARRKPGGAQRRHVVRIVGGRWRGRQLPVLTHPQLRPTPDRVRETLFNWLGQDLTGWHCLDAFAGSGVLGLEAASRGAASVLLVEQDAGLAHQLQASAGGLGATEVRVTRGNALLALALQPPHSLDLVFLDPPFDAPQLAKEVLPAAARAVRGGGFVYLETAAPLTAAELAAQPLALHRHLKAGAVHAQLLVAPLPPPA